MQRGLLVSPRRREREEGKAREEIERSGDSFIPSRWNGED